jgi:hypothetical protein
MPDEMTSVLAQLENLMEARVVTLTTDALAERQPWIRRCGARPVDPETRRRWETAVRVVAAYRDRYGLTDDIPVGPVPSTDLERLDHGRAVLALGEAGRLAATAHSGQPEAERGQAQALGG